ncbi:MAG: YceI family protein [Pseudomonadota bacterium]
MITRTTDPLAAPRRRRSSLQPFLALAALLAATFSTTPAAALNWRIDPAESAIAFRYTEDGAPEVGAFAAFKGVAEFDAARPHRARLDLIIEVDSIELKDAFRSGFVQSETWFDSAAHPRALFRLERIALAPSAPPAAADEPRPYDVEGVLTIKGVSLPIATQIDLTLQDRVARAVGEVRFDRRAFSIGDAFGALFVDIGAEIIVAFDIVAKRI